jgi:hypothetical protein
MRARVIVLSVSVGLLGGALAIQACGGSDAATDDAPDAAEAGVREGGALDVSEPEPACDPKTDLTRKVKDASIGDGASTTGICLGCAKAKCAEAIASCQADCPCQGIVSNAIECYLTTQQIGCAVALADYLVTPATRKYALGVLGCVRSECPQECAVEAGAPDPDPDAGSNAGDAGDASDARDASLLD